MTLLCNIWPRPVFRLRTDRPCPQKPNPSRETVPLKFAYGTVLVNLLCPTCPLLIGFDYVFYDVSLMTSRSSPWGSSDWLSKFAYYDVTPPTFLRALPDWLLQSSRLADSFYPAPHAVTSLPSTLPTRTVFARMMVNQRVECE